MHNWEANSQGRTWLCSPFAVRIPSRRQVDRDWGFLVVLSERGEKLPCKRTQIYLLITEQIPFCWTVYKHIESHFRKQACNVTLSSIFVFARSLILLNLIESLLNHQSLEVKHQQLIDVILYNTFLKLFYFLNIWLIDLFIFYIYSSMITQLLNHFAFFLLLIYNDITSYFSIDLNIIIAKGTFSFSR